MAKQQTALVIGAGIIGVTSAYALARDGWQVTVIDCNPKVAQEASWGNGRQLSYSHTNALGCPEVMLQVPRLLAGYDEAFRFRLSPTIGSLDWLLRFLRNCTRTAFRRNTLECLTLAEESRAALDRLLACHDIEFDRVAAGKMVLLRSEKELQDARASLRFKRDSGLDQELLSFEEALAIEPALAHSGDPISGVLFSPRDETGDCSRFASELMNVLRTAYGVEFLAGRQVIAIGGSGRGHTVSLSDGLELVSDAVVLATGHRANALLAPLRLALPIVPMKGYSFAAPAGSAAPRVSITDSKRRIVFTNLGERMLVAGIAELGNGDHGVEERRLASMKRAAADSLPAAMCYEQSSAGWAGHRPMTPDSLPIIRRLAGGLFANLGHGMLGWTLAMGSADRLSRLMCASR